MGDTRRMTPMEVFEDGLVETKEPYTVVYLVDSQHLPNEKIEFLTYDAAVKHIAGLIDDGDCLYATITPAVINDRFR